jgi:hypothetical protein
MSKPSADSEPASTVAADPAEWGDSASALPHVPAASQYEADPSPGDPMATIGHIGRYALKYKIGEGGLGSVYAAHDPLLSRLIAIKTLNVEVEETKRSEFNALFLHEARAAAGLSHPHIVTVFDAGVSDSKAYIAMELLKGRDLRQLRKEGWRPNHAQAALIVRRVADALAYAHSKGVVHCDIKPANIFMLSRTQPRVLDFGISRVTHKHDGHGPHDITGGSPYYMAPEQVRHQPIDRRTDVFALGIVLYELLTDQKPFRGDTLGAITDAVQNHTPPPAHTLNPDVPKALSEIASRAMEKDMAHRFRSARALSRELRQWLEEHGQESDIGNDAFTPARSRRLLALGAGLLALGGLGAWSWLSHRAPTPPATAARPAAVAAAPAASVAASAALPATPPAALPTAPPAAASSTAPLLIQQQQREDLVEPSLPLIVAEPASMVSDAPLLPPLSLAPAPPPAPVTMTLGSLPAKARDKPRERSNKARDAGPAGAKPSTVPPSATGLLRIAISPWGQVEVDGSTVGLAPPLSELSLPEGRHQVTIRNGDFPPYSVNIRVTAGQPVAIKHRFGP